MTEHDEPTGGAPNMPGGGHPIEEHGIDAGTAAAIVSAGAAVTSAGVSIYNATRPHQRPSDPPPPPPPSIELPPGADRE